MPNYNPGAGAPCTCKGCHRAVRHERVICSGCEYIRSKAELRERNRHGRYTFCLGVLFGASGSIVFYALAGALL